MYAMDMMHEQKQSKLLLKCLKCRSNVQKSIPGNVVLDMKTYTNNMEMVFFVASQKWEDDS